MDTESARRMGRNEALFRAANEAIQRGAWPGEEDRRLRFRCECVRLDCNTTVELTPAEYERVRADGRRFVVADGHERPEIETVVAGADGHLVVQKRGAAGLEAEASDPRS